MGDIESYQCGDSPVFLSPPSTPPPSWRPTVSPSHEEEDHLTLSTPPSPSETPATIPSLLTPSPVLFEKPSTTEIVDQMEEKPAPLPSLALIVLPIGVIAHYFFSRRQ
jgi:hypothetical protein